MDVIQEIRNDMAKNGLLTTNPLIANSSMQRFCVEGSQKKDESGWYIIFNNQRFTVALYGCWRLGRTFQWSEKAENTMTPEDRKAYTAIISEAKLKQEAAKKEAHNDARKKAIEIVGKCLKATNQHPYLLKKQINVYGSILVSNSGQLVIPMYDTNKALHSLQFINEDGSKIFLKDGQKKGNYFSIGQLTERIYIVEGYATAATIHMATECATVVAFDSGNLLPVAKNIKEKYPKHTIIFAADNDQFTEGNPGLTKAAEAAQSIGADTVKPDFKNYSLNNKPTDFNDLMQLAGIDEVRRQLLTNSENLTQEWDIPKTIENELRPVQHLDPSLIPEPLRAFSIDVSERMQCPLDFIVITALATVAAVVGAGCVIKPKEYDDWRVIPNLWGCIVGRPGIMKTPAVSEVIKVLDNLQKESKLEFDEHMKKYNAELESYKLRKEVIKKEITKQETKLLKGGGISSPTNNTDGLTNSLCSLSEPKKPAWKRFKTNDSTIEKLNELLAENPRGIMVYRDEVIGLLNSFEKSGHESDRAFYLEGWNGNSSNTSDRISRGTIYTENLCLSIFGTTQPDKLLSYLRGALYGENDGFIQRFQLIVYPDDPKTWELVDRKPNLQEKTRAFTLIKKLSNMDFLIHGAQLDDDNNVPYFHFSKEAQLTFNQWLEHLEKNKLRGEEHPILIEHLSKYRKLMPSLALLFHLIDLADGNIKAEVSDENVHRATAWCDYLESHARRIYGLVLDIESRAASVLAEKLQQKKLQDGFTLRNVYRLRGLLKTKEIAHAACDELVEANWLKEVVIPPSKGQKEVTTYRINPKIYESNDA